MKKIVLSFFLMGFLTLVSAQAPIAILTHGGNMAPYYGTSALVDAYAAAQTGDIITLSPGVFNAVEIRKALTIRGAGMMTDSAAGTLRTTINGNFNIHNDNTGDYLTFEGLYIEGEAYMDTIYNLNFTKCFINKFVKPSYSSDGVYNATFTHCIIRDIRTAWLHNSHFYNCVLRENTGSGADFFSSDNSTVCSHCIIQLRNDGGINHFHSTNSILLLDDGNANTGTANNCLNHEYCIGICAFDESFFHPASHMVGQHNHNYIWPFQVFGGENYFDRDVTVFAGYHLNIQDSTIFIGSDGTEIGIYGGAMPFNPRVSNPSIGHITVAGQTNTEGELPVEIEVVTE